MQDNKKTKNKEQLYCVVATNRRTDEREALTEGLPKEVAFTEKKRMNGSRAYKKTHVYFSVAKYPYKHK